MAATNEQDAIGNPKNKTQLGKYCVAGGPGNVSCKNNSSTEGISMHTLPKSEGRLRNLWIKFVQRHRGSKWKTSSYSALCSAHFEPQYFLQRPDITVLQLDQDKPFQTKQMLDRKVAHPTIDTVEPERQVRQVSDREQRKVNYCFGQY